MRLPFLQVWIEESRELGEKLALRAAKRGIIDPLRLDSCWWRGKLEDVWDCGRRASGDKRPDGVLRGDDAAEFLARVSRYPGSANELESLLSEVGLVVRIKTGLRVRGVAELYGPAWDRQNVRIERASKAAKARWKNAPSIDQAQAEHEHGNAKTETETEKKKEDVPHAAQKPPRKPPKPSAAQELFAWLNATRATKTPLSDSPISAVAINTRFGEALNQHGRPTIERAYLAFLELAEPAAMTPPHPWQSFLKRLPMLAGSALRVASQSESLSL